MGAEVNWINNQTILTCIPLELSSGVGAYCFCINNEMEPGKVVKRTSVVRRTRLGKTILVNKSVYCASTLFTKDAIIKIIAIRAA